MVALRPFWSLHTHSKFSFNDALPAVHDMVEAAARYGYPALGLTDHGNPSGSVQLYRECRRAGIEPLPGMETYLVPDTVYAGRKDNLHLTLAAYSETGYRNLCKLATLASAKFWYKPQLDMADLAAFAENGDTQGLVVATGCYGGLLPQVLLRSGERDAVKVAQTLAGWFPRVYVELQNHGTGADERRADNTDDISDDEMVEALWSVAQRAGLPVVITRDSHYVEEADALDHQAMKRLLSWSDDPDDAVFFGTGYHMTDAAGMRPFFPPHILAAGLEGLESLADAAYVRLPELETFTMKVPDVLVAQDDPQAVFEEKVLTALGDRTQDPEILRWVRSEFDVIRIAGMAPYLLLVDLVAEFMREKAIRYVVRGSACGSYCMYALNVTNTDPIKFVLRPDRFLSTNRTKPPDVDFDVEHTRRDEVIEFLTQHWSVSAIGSFRKYKLEEEEEGDESSGSLRVRYFATRHKQGKPDVPWRSLPKDERDTLIRLHDRKLYAGYGTHAAGYIVAPNEAVIAQLPKAYIASSKKAITAYGKEDVEILGFTKLDLLGARTQTAIRIMCETSGVDFESIDEHDADTYRKISRGETEGVFQLSGRAAAPGCRQLRPRNLSDVIAAMALFRPATRTSGATMEFLARRNKKEEPPKRHPDIMAATKDTYGVLLYQEQVMDVMETLGLDKSELEEMLTAVKASNDYREGAASVIAAMRPHLEALAGARGWNPMDINWLTHGLTAYADYSFNKGHAAAYGLVAYRTAYMRVHHPLEFWHGMFIGYWDDKNHIGTYEREAGRDGIRVRPAHVNHSKALYTIDSSRPNTIRKGLIRVKGIGPTAAAELEAKAPFTSLKDLGERVVPRKVSGARNLVLGMNPAESGGQIAALYDADALDGLE